MIHLAAIDLKREKINTLLIPVCEDSSIHTDAAILALVESALGLEEFQGKKDQEVILYNPPGLSVERALFRGLGKAAKLDAEGLRQMAGKSLKRCAKMGVARLWVAVPHAVGLSLDASCLLTALLEGAVLGNHVFDRYKQEKETKPLARVDFLVPAEHSRRFQKLAAQIGSKPSAAAPSSPGTGSARPPMKKLPSSSRGSSRRLPKRADSPPGCSRRPSCSAENSGHYWPSAPAA